MICYFDLETNSKEAMEAEIITGYFKLVNDNVFLRDFNYKSQVDKWSYEAEEIHGISEAECKSYPNKFSALNELNHFLSTLPSETKFVLYANPNNMGQFYYFDKTIIEMQFMLHGLRFKFPAHDSELFESVYDKTKDAYLLGYFQPMKSDKGRISFRQDLVYHALFGDKYNAHNAVDDVNALQRIDIEISKMLISGKGNKNQLELF